MSLDRRAALARIATALSALILIAAPACAQLRQGHAAGFDYEEVVLGDPATPGMPLIIALHYSGGTPRESLANYDALGAPVRIVAPRGTHRKRDGFSYYPPNYYALDPAEQLRIARETEGRIAVFVADMAKLHGVKPVVTGISQGGDLSLLLALYHPDLIAAALPFAAVLRPEVAQAGMADGKAAPPIHMFQGEADEIVLVAETRRQVAVLAKHAPVTLKTYPGLGHDISPAMKADYTALLDKLLANRR